MTQRISFVLFAVLFVSVSVIAQTSPEPRSTPAPAVQPTPKPTATEKVTIKTNVTKEQYADLLKKVKAGDMSVDFALLRLAYTATTDYSPYGGAELRSQMATQFRAGSFDDTIKTANKMLETNYVDLHAHYWAALAYSELNKTKEAESHKAVLSKLMSAIQQNDGLSAKTAMLSIGIAEQYFVMSIMGFERQSKALVQEDGSVFDVHTSYNKETKETRKFYFNIDKVFGKF